MDPGDIVYSQLGQKIYKMILIRKDGTWAHLCVGVRFIEPENGIA
jgi:hypothetical protein